jgi:hypothetical protein
MVVNHVVKGMPAVTFEIGVNLFQSTLGVRGKNGGGSCTRRFEVAEARRKEKMYSMYLRCI